ncbi:MAG: HNH endonuclease [Prevotellaceae bacterium]|jgi:hypothetical protein|nr:HNH endonuclease [Prevotellaceae bacterium]
MSYEGDMLKKLAMPTKQDVEKVLLKTLFKHNGIIKEFSSGEEIVEEIADLFLLNEEQRKVVLERIYKKENRIVKTPLWHRLLYRAADSLAKEKLVTRPTTTIQLTNRKEWMLTENGYDKALRLLDIPFERKEVLPVKSFEVQKLIKRMTEMSAPENYDPIDNKKVIKTTSKEASIRSRGFRQIVLESYDCKCCICGLKIKSPDSLYWEVEAAHIVPHTRNGKDDVWNGLALCRLHHWAFDVGWFSITDDFKIIVSDFSKNIPDDYGKIGSYDFFKDGLVENKPVFLPANSYISPHKKAIQWHRENIFYR